MRAKRKRKFKYKGGKVATRREGEGDEEKAEEHR